MMIDQVTIQELIASESKNIEFKETFPKNSGKYTKTLVAYANSQGGYLIFGVAGKTRKIVGIAEDTLFQTMDDLANAISDSCEPRLSPDMEPCTVEGKTIIIVTVHPEPGRPYYLKSKGKENGTYIRVGADTCLASPEKIKELEMEGAKVSWDELTCVGYTVTDDAIETLCHDINVRRAKMREQKGLAEELPAVTKTNLENWKLLKKSNDGYLASNAFVLLTSDFFPFSKTQCAVFKGSDRSVFLDKREYSGPIYTQVEDAVNFVLRNIRLEAKIDGLIRKESYELPVDAIREMIVNAHCHRNLTDESCVQVSIFDDRLEVSSPGGLYNGLTFDEAMRGRSRLRNRAIANVFSQMGFIEAWGSGLQRIRHSAKEYDLPEPDFLEMPGSFRVNLYRAPLQTRNPEKTSNDLENASQELRNNCGKTAEQVQKSAGKTSRQGRKNFRRISEENRNNDDPKLAKFFSDNRDKLNLTQLKIAFLLSKDPLMDASRLAMKMCVTRRCIESNIKKLRDLGLIVRHGSKKKGYWRVVK